MTTRRATQLIVETEYIDSSPKRRATQLVVETEYLDAAPKRRATQLVTEVEYIDATPKRRATQLIVEVEYLAATVIYAVAARSTAEARPPTVATSVAGRVQGPAVVFI